MSQGTVLDFRGKKMTAGPLVLWMLTTGVMYYSRPEDVKRDGDYHVFDGSKTLLVSVAPDPARPGAMSINFVKLNETGFRPMTTRVPLSSIAQIQDIGNDAVVAKAEEALSGLVIPTRPDVMN